MRSPGPPFVEPSWPRLRLLAWRLDKPGYLRQASVTYGSLEALRAGWRAGDAVLSLNNNAAAYAPEPGRFAFLFEKDANSACAGILAKLARDEFRWLVLPADGPGPAVAGCLAGVTDALPVYRDAHFASYRLGGARP